MKVVKLLESSDLPVARFNEEEAMNLSIMKWELLVEALEAVKASALENETCGLCRKYFHEYAEGVPSCFDCPVCEKTRQQGCRGTPFDKFNDSLVEALEDAREFKEFLEQLKREVKSD